MSQYARYPTLSVTGGVISLNSMVGALSLVAGTNITIVPGSGTLTINASAPILSAGSVAFSDGATLTQDNANFFWDDTNKRLGIGTNAPNASLQVIGDINQSISATDSGAIGIITSSTTHTTVDGSNTTVGNQTAASATVSSGATNDKAASGSVNTVTRGDGTDDGILDALTGITNLTFHNSGASGVTNKYYGTANLLFTQQGNIVDAYDFYSQVVPAGIGTITNHYGIYISDDPGTPVVNYLSGKLVLGGAFATPGSDTLYLNGDATMTGVFHSLDTNESIDPNGRHLIKNGNNVVDWDVQRLADESGTESLHWKDRLLKDNGGNTVLDYTGSVKAIAMTGDISTTGDISAATMTPANGASGTFTTADLKTVTVVNGIITSIV